MTDQQPMESVGGKEGGERVEEEEEEEEGRTAKIRKLSRVNPSLSHPFLAAPGKRRLGRKEELTS